MAKLIFRFGAMGASKTANAIMTAFNYEEQGKNVLVLKPSADTRSGNELSSRIGISWPAIPVQTCDIEALAKFAKGKLPDGTTVMSHYDAVIVDEAQFLSRSSVDALASIVDEYEIPVLCYGLKTNFRGFLFEGSKRLMELADEIEEIPTICWCGRKARFNARVDELGNVVLGGPELMVGWNERYVPLCRKHYMQGRSKE